MISESTETTRPTTQTTTTGMIFKKMGYRHTLCLYGHPLIFSKFKSCGDPESFVRGRATFDQRICLLFSMSGGERIQINTKSGPSPVKRHLHFNI